MSALLVTLPPFLIDIGVVFSLGASTLALFSQQILLAQTLVGLSLFRFGIGLCMVRGALSGDGPGEIALAIGDSLPTEAGVALVLVTSVVLGGIVARAASRSAEVVARFSLDALPGAQAALEADLKQSIDPLSGIEARNLLLQKARGRGAADGAARILIGDALLAPLLGAFVALFPVLFGGESALFLPLGIGVSALTLAAAIPAAAALTRSLTEQEGQLTERKELWSATICASLLLVANSPWLPILLVSGFFFLLYFFRPKRETRSRLVALLPKTSKAPKKLLRISRNQIEKNLGVFLPEIELGSTRENEVQILLYDREIARDKELTKALILATPKLFGPEEARKVLQNICKTFPASASAIQVSFSLLTKVFQQLLQQGFSLEEDILANTLALLPKKSSDQEEEILQTLRSALFHSLEKKLPSPPIPVVRLDDIIEDELLRKKPLGNSLIQELCAARDLFLSETNKKPILLFCPKEIRNMVQHLLGTSDFLILSPNELAPKTELLFLGELSPSSSKEKKT